MEAVCRYLVSVTAAAIICGIINSVLEKSKTAAAIGKLLTGLFLAITVISPLIKIELSDFLMYTDALSADAQMAVSAGETAADNVLREIIISKTEAYILDKATSLDASLTVKVELSDGDPPQPSAVQLFGTISPYAKAQLTRYITEQLGIPKEAQQWNG